MSKISIIIPTFERGDLLWQCLLALSGQLRVDMSDVEVIVVENGPISGANEITNSLSERFQSLRYFHEGALGVSRARNLGLRHAKGEILAFLDDDEVPEPEWLSELIRPFFWTGQRANIVCGENEPIWHEDRPEWLSDSLLHSYSVCARWSPDVAAMESGQWVFEGNCAVETKLLRNAGGFDEALGRVSGDLLSGEGIIFEKIRMQGALAVFNPAAVVRHHIFAEQLTLEWLFRRWFAQGREDAINHGDNPEWPARLSKATLQLDVFANQSFDNLTPAQVLKGAQLHRTLGFVAQSQGVL